MRDDSRAFFNYITTAGAFTPVSPLFAPVVKQDSQMSWTLLIISKKSTLLKKLHLPAFSYPLTFSTFHLIMHESIRTAIILPGEPPVFDQWLILHRREFDAKTFPHRRAFDPFHLTDHWRKIGQRSR